jgi:DNA-binding FrmR family transcriptional regulator
LEERTVDSQAVDATCREKALHRLHRIQGQLVALERAIEDDQPCEPLVIQARAAEKALTSLIVLLLHHHLETRIPDLLLTDSEQALREMRRLLELVNR